MLMPHGQIRNCSSIHSIPGAFIFVTDEPAPRVAAVDGVHAHPVPLKSRAVPGLRRSLVPPGRNACQENESEHTGGDECGPHTTFARSPPFRALVTLSQ